VQTLPSQQLHLDSVHPVLNVQLVISVLMRVWVLHYNVVSAFSHQVVPRNAIDVILVIYVILQPQPKLIWRRTNAVEFNV